MLGSIPGMPHFVFLLLGGGLGYAAWLMKKRAAARKKRAPSRDAGRRPQANTEASWDDLRRSTRSASKSAIA